MAPTKRVALALAVATLSSCGPSTFSQDASDGLFEVSATVLEAPGKPAMLCVGAIRASLPPQCGDLSIPNWDWDGVEGESAAAGTTWGEYHVVGTFDGDTFTLVGPPGPFRSTPPEDDDRFLSPCPEPPGGWEPLDPSQTTDAARSRAFALARAQPDFAGLWIDNRTTQPGANNPREMIVNVRFTGSLEERERQLREVWGGALCVTGAEHTFERLQEIADEIGATAADDLGLRLLSSGVDPVANVVSIGVVFADSKSRQALDDRYGPGVVEITSALAAL